MHGLRAEMVRAHAHAYQPIYADAVPHALCLSHCVCSIMWMRGASDEKSVKAAIQAASRGAPELASVRVEMPAPPGEALALAL